MLDDYKCQLCMNVILKGFMSKLKILDKTWKPPYSMLQLECCQRLFFFNSVKYDSEDFSQTYAPTGHAKSND